MIKDYSYYENKLSSQKLIFTIFLISCNEQESYKSDQKIVLNCSPKTILNISNFLSLPLSTSLHKRNFTHCILYKHIDRNFLKFIICYKKSFKEHQEWRDSTCNSFTSCSFLEKSSFLIFSLIFNSPSWSMLNGRFWFSPSISVLPPGSSSPISISISGMRCELPMKFVPLPETDLKSVSGFIGHDSDKFLRSFRSTSSLLFIYQFNLDSACGSQWVCLLSY